MMKFRLAFSRTWSRLPGISVPPIRTSRYPLARAPTYPPLLRIWTIRFCWIGPQPSSIARRSQSSLTGSSAVEALVAAGGGGTCRAFYGSNAGCAAGPPVFFRILRIPERGFYWEHFYPRVLHNLL